MEYVIRGIPPGEKNMHILVEKFDGQYVTDRDVAEKLSEMMIANGNTNVRIQEINLHDNFIL